MHFLKKSHLWEDRKMSIVWKFSLKIMIKIWVTWSPAPNSEKLLREHSYEPSYLKERNPKCLVLMSRNFIILLWRLDKIADLAYIYFQIIIFPVFQWAIETSPSLPFPILLEKCIVSFSLTHLQFGPEGTELNLINKCSPGENTSRNRIYFENIPKQIKILLKLLLVLKSRCVY